jgi:uncharacterized protein YutE (UPF0331/DUF86 family)
MLTVLAARQWIRIRTLPHGDSRAGVEALSMTVCEAALDCKWDLLMLFGSRARENHRPDSDYDLGILAGSGTRDLGRLCEALGTQNVDVAWLDEASWLLCQEVARDGVALFERTPEQAEDFRVAARLRSWDADVWRRRNRSFVARSLEGDLALNKDLVERKLALLTQYLGELKPILEISETRFVSDPMVHHAAERLVELLIECAGSINTEISQAVGGIPPSDYYSSFFSLSSTGWIDRDTAEALARWARLRNTLVHRYESVGLDELYRELQAIRAPWLHYVKSIRGRL